MIFSFGALHTYGRQLNQHPNIHLLVTRGGLIKYDIWKPIFSKRKASKKSGVMPLFDCFSIAIFNYNPTH
ncbi:TPA: transposase [Providencia rettgeri]|uniref:Transposase IS801/IS1294 domain-containing protein n=1 Tax=Providencia rettgeri TaxID=587 RepID=A0A264VNW9_PRORE|nr:hypothetical protein CHI95_18880 [Providencia rettgeri]HEC8326261.1 transposase [Providencia rettgeri]